MISCGLWLLIWADFKSCLGLTHLLSLCHTYSPLHYVNFSIPEQQKGSSDDSSAVVEKGGRELLRMPGIISRERRIISR